MTDLQHDLRTGVVEPGDHEKFSHLVPGKNGVSGRELVMMAMVEGTPVTALCGKTWVPTRDPERFPICPDCLRVAKERGLFA